MNFLSEMKLCQGFQKEIQRHLLEPLRGYLLNDIAKLILEYAEKVPYDVWDRKVASLVQGGIEINDSQVKITASVQLFDNESISFGQAKPGWIKHGWVWGHVKIKLRQVWNTVYIKWKVNNSRVYTTYHKFAVKVISFQNQIWIADPSSITIWYLNETPKVYGTIRFPNTTLHDMVMLTNGSLLIVFKGPHAHHVRLLEK